MSTTDEIYKRKITQMQQQFGGGLMTDMFIFTNNRCAASEDKITAIESEFSKYQETSKLFESQTFEEFKKIWKKLKEIEARLPGPVVTPPVPIPKPDKPPAASSKK